MRWFDNALFAQLKVYDWMDGYFNIEKKVLLLNTYITFAI